MLTFLATLDNRPNLYVAVSRGTLVQCRDLFEECLDKTAEERTETFLPCFTFHVFSFYYFHASVFHTYTAGSKPNMKLDFKN
jgi:hypothetical protein